MIVEIKLFMKELNKRIVLVEDLLHQGNSPRMRSKKAKRWLLNGRCESVLETELYIHVSIGNSGM